MERPSKPPNPVPVEVGPAHEPAEGFAEAAEHERELFVLHAERGWDACKRLQSTDAPTERRQWRSATALGKRHARPHAPRKLGIDKHELRADPWKVVDAIADAAGRRRHSSAVGTTAPFHDPRPRVVPHGT